MTRPAVPGEFLEGYTRILADVCVTGRRLTRDERESLRAQGKRAAEAGHELRTLVRCHLAETRAFSPALAAVGVDRVLAAVEQAVDAFAEGHERAQRPAMRQEEADRREFIDDLLYGRSDLGRLAERAERYGLLFSRAHAVAVAGAGSPWTTPTRPPGASRPPCSAASRSAASCSPPRTGGWSASPRLTRTTSSPSSPSTPTRPPTEAGSPSDAPHSGAGGVVDSYEEALNALELADRLDLQEPVLRAAELLVYPVLTRDRQAMADLVRDTLGPLRGARGGARPLLDTLTAYFDAGCTAAEAARRLGLSIRAFTYRLERIHKLTGADPADPVHRYTLQTAVIGARLLGWPDSDV